MAKAIDPNKYFYARTLLTQNLSIAEVRKELKKIFGSSISPNRLVELKAEIESDVPIPQIIKPSTGLSRIFGGKSDKLAHLSTQIEMFNEMIAKMDQQAILIHQLFNKFEKYSRTFAYWETRFANVDFVENIHDGPAGITDEEFFNHRKAPIHDFIQANPTLIRKIITVDTINIIAQTTNIHPRIVELVLREIFGDERMAMYQWDGPPSSPSDTQKGKKDKVKPALAVKIPQAQDPVRSQTHPTAKLQPLGITDPKSNMDSIIAPITTNCAHVFDVEYSTTRTAGMTKLDLSNLGITSLHDIKGLAQLKDVQILDLSENNITQIDFSGTTFQNSPLLQTLQRLVLRFNQISEIRGLDQLKNLEVLYLSQNQLTTMEESGVRDLKKLYVLDLSENNFDSVRGIAGIENLTQLDLSYNQIQSWNGIEQLISLTTLNLAHNRFLDFEGLEESHLINLKSLDLTHNQIDSLEGLEYLRELDQLVLAENKLQETHASMGTKFTTIKWLDLSKNQLIDVLGLEIFPAVEDLNAADNHIESCVGIEQMKFLRKLNLSRNGLKLDQFTQLMKLDFQGNEISALQGLGQLDFLTELRLEGNRVYDWVKEEWGVDPAIIAKQVVSYCKRLKY